jgi:hypothetical protein
LGTGGFFGFFPDNQIFRFFEFKPGFWARFPGFLLIFGKKRGKLMYFWKVGALLVKAFGRPSALDFDLFSIS